MSKNIPTITPQKPENAESHFEKPDVLKAQFSAMVETLRAKTLPHERAIAEGENPFKIWREHKGGIKDDVAETLGLDLLDYLDIEDDVHVATSQDIIKFCQHFSLHPYDLMGDANDAMSDGMVDALLAVYDNPKLLPHKRVGTQDLARQLLTDEASTAYYNLEKTRDAMQRHYPRHQGLTIAFISGVLEKDGDLNITYETLSLKEHGEWFWQMADDERHSARVMQDHFTREWNRHGKNYNLFGRYLFREGWGDISKSLSLTFRFAGIDNAMELYMNDPQFIGRKSWPDLAVPLFINQQSYTWRQAHFKHWQYAEPMFLAFEEKQKYARQVSTLDFQCNLFDEWLGRHENMLWRFENRQKIIKHPDFAYLKDTSPKKMLEYHPDKPKP